MIFFFLFIHLSILIFNKTYTIFFFYDEQSVFLRQEIVRKQNEAKQEQERKEKEKRELLESLESEPKATAPKQNLTPLISPAALIPPRFPPRIKPFAPVSSMMAIERAKEKVLQLKAQKAAQHQQFMPKTIAQTAAKGTGRIAHTNSTSTTNNTTTTTNNAQVQISQEHKQFHVVRYQYMSFSIHFVIEYKTSTARAGAHINQNIVQHSNAILQFDGKTLLDHL